MYCKNCGNEIKDNERFCSKCGTGICQNNILEVQRTETTNEKKPSKKLLTIIGFSIVVVVLIIIIWLSSKPGYEKLMDKYFEAQETVNAELYYDIVSEDWMIWLEGSPLEDSKSDFIDYFQEELEEKLEDYKDECGENISISYEILSVYKANDEQIEELKEEVDYLETASVTDACVLQINFTVTGDMGTQNKYFPNGFLVIKVNGKWCIPRGAIDLSWHDFN